MAIDEHAVIIRFPSVARVYAVVFGVLWCGLLSALVIRSLIDGDGGVFIVIPIVMIAVGAVLIVGPLRIKVAASGDTMLVRNAVKTWRLSRREISNFRIEVEGSRSGKVVQAVLYDATVITLEVTRRALVSPRGERRIEQQARDLQQWLGPMLREAHGQRPPDIALPEALRRSRPAD